MNTYEEMYRALLELCKNEGLHLIEAELKNEGILFWIYNNCIVINTAYKCKEGKEKREGSPSL